MESSQKEILSAVSNALDGGRHAPSEGSTISLTPRESEALMHLFNGCSYRKIASNMSHVRVTSHRSGGDWLINMRQPVSRDQLLQELDQTQQALLQLRKQLVDADVNKLSQNNTSSA